MADLKTFETPLEKIESSKQLQQQSELQRQEEMDKYFVPLNDFQRDVIKSYVDMAKTPEEREDYSYRAANAIKYSQWLNIPVEEAFNNLDYLNSQYIGGSDTKTPKSNFIAITDNFEIGMLQSKRNEIGKKLMEAETNGYGTVKELRAELAEVDAKINSLSDEQVRSLPIDALKNAALSLPFTARGIAAQTAGSIVLGPIGGIVVGTLSSWDAMAGQEYLEMTEDGHAPILSRNMALVSSLFQGMVESMEGLVPAYAATFGTAEKVASTGVKAMMNNITKNFFRNVYTSGTLGKIASTAGKAVGGYIVSAAGEGLEEVEQGAISAVAKCLATAIDEYAESNSLKDATGAAWDKMKSMELASKAMEDFKGGFLGALVLGAPNIYFDAKATINDFAEVGHKAETIESKEAFIKETADSPVFDGMTEEAKAEAQEEIYSKYEPQRKTREEERRALEKDRAETIYTSDNTEEVVEDADGVIEAPEAYRNEEGRLDYADTVIDENEDGSTENQYLVKGKGNQEYGRILYNEDADGNITINAFEMSAMRENLRQEVFTDFAEQHAGKSIEWNTTGNAAASVKENLINNNIRGNKNGLNYFADRNEVQNQRTRIKWDKQIKEAIPSMDSDQRSAGIALVESFANKHGMNIADYNMQVFNDKLFINEASLEAYKQALEQNMDTKKIGGYVDISELGKSTKGIIYASEKGDATTWVHENAHIFRQLMNAEELAEAEKLFNVKDGKWTRQNEEDFAYTLQGYAFENKAVGEAKPLFEKLAQALVRVYNALKGKIDFNPELSEFIEGLFADPSTALAQAKRAVEQNERASYKTEAKETVNENEEVINNTAADTNERVEAAVDKAAEDAGIESNDNIMLYQSKEESERLFIKNKAESKGVYLAANQARHDNYNMDYNDYDGKYGTNIVGDMLEVDLDDYDYVIATPPCDYWTRQNKNDDSKKSDYALKTKHLLPDTIVKLAESGKPFIIENVKNFKRMEENGIWDLTDKYNLYVQFVGRHTYITNVLGDYTTEQKQDFDANGNFINEGSYRQGGTNVHSVIEKWIDNLMHTVDLKEDTAEQLQDYNENASILFQGAQTMYGVHNLSADALEHAIKMGGLANPSMAVVDSEVQQFTKFGDISLIPYRYMIDKSEGKNAGTFGADIYSPRYPTVNTFVTSKGNNTAKEIFKGIEDEEARYHFASSLVNLLESHSFNRRFLADTTLPIAYLAEKGNKDFIVYDNKLEGYSKEEIETLKNFNDYREEEARKYISELVLNKYIAKWDKLIEEAKSEVKNEELLKKEIALLEKEKESETNRHIDPDTGYVWYTEGDTYLYDFKKALRNNNKIDESQTKANASELVRNDKAFIDWAKEKVDSIEKEEKIFDGYTPSGNRKYLSHTLSNVSKYMRKQGLRDGENFGYGLGSTRAHFAPKFTTLAQIRKAKNRLVTGEQFKEIKKENEEVFDELLELVSDGYDYDTGTARLLEAYTTKGVNPITYLNDEYGIELSDEDARKMNGFMYDLKNMPTEYFETKFERPVYLNEFAAAIIPNNTSESLKKSIKELGLEIREYEPGVENHAEALKKEIPELGQKKAILFQYMDEILDEATLNEASTFDTWEEWYEFAKAMDTDGIINGAWDNVAEQEWFKSAWESAHKIYNTEQKVDPEEELKKDRDFVELINRPGYLEDFLNRAKYYINEELWQPADEEDLKEVEAKRESQLFAARVMTDETHFYKNLDSKQKQKLLTMIESAPREYRKIYAEVFFDESMKVPEGYEYTADMSVVPGDMVYKVQMMTPSQRRKYIESIQDEKIKQQLKSGKMPMDSTLENYMKVAQKEIRRLEKEVKRLEDELKEDTKNINNAQKKYAIEEYGRLSKMVDTINAIGLKGNMRVSTAMSAGAMATSNVVDASENGQYNTIMQRMADIEKMVAGERDAVAIIEKYKEKQRQKILWEKRNAERKALAELSRMKKSMIKRLTRKVSFENTDYEDAKKIIAVQNFVDHWVRTGVNLWIGNDEVTAAEVWQQYKTDTDYRAEIDKALNELIMKKNATAERVRNNLHEAMSDEGKSFEQWTPNMKNDLMQVLGLNDHVVRMNLDKLKELRKQSMHSLLDDKGNITEECMKIVYDTLPKEMIARIRYTPMNKWTFEQVEELVKIVDDIHTEGKKVYAGRQQLRRDRYAEIRKRIQDTVRDTGIRFEAGDTPEDIKRKKEQINKILGLRTQAKGTAASMSERQTMREKFMAADRGTGNVRRFSRVMDNWSEGVFTDTLCFREYMAYDDEQKYIRERTRHVQGYMKEHGITWDRLAETYTYTKLFDNEDKTFNVDELLYIYIANKDDMSREAVMYGNFMTSEEKESVKQHESRYDDGDGRKWFKFTANARFNRVLFDAKMLIEKDKALAGLVEVIENDYEKQYERLNRTSIEVFNMPVNRVSEYVPLYRLEQTGDTNEQQVAKDILADTAGAPSSYVGRGMTKNRVTISPMNQKPVQLGLVQTWASSMEKTEHFINYGELVRDLNAIYTGNAAAATREAIASRYGSNANDYIKEYINELANPNKGTVHDELGRWIHALRGSTAPAYLAWKSSGIIKQLCTSPWPFMAYITPVEYISAATEFVAHYNTMTNFVKEKSVFMDNRNIDPIIDLIKEAQNDKNNRYRAELANFNKIGMQGLEIADWVSVAPGWYAAYKKKYAELENMNKKLAPMSDGYKSSEDIEKESIAYADDIVRLTQPSSRKADLAPLFKNSSEAAKMILQFQTSLNVIYQNLRFDIPYQIKNRQWKNAVGAIIGYTAAGILMNAVVSGLFTGDGSDDEPDEKLKRLVWYATTQFTDSVPVMGNVITNTAQKMLTGENMYGSSSMFPVLDRLSKVMTDISDDKYGKAAEDFASGVAYYLGLPVSGAKEAMRVFGIGDNDGEIDFKPEALWGRR